MAGRKNKHTVDYFPHYCKGESKTLFILENKFGLKGYAVWYKTLEILGGSEHHFIDLRNETDLLFLISKMKITEEELINIYDLLSKLDAIDFDLWSNKIVFSENFINNVEDAYARRNGINVLHKLDLCKHLSIKCVHKRTNQSKEEESKEKKEYIYSEFYDTELENKKEEHHPHYKNFVDFLFGNNEINEKMEGVLKLKGQISNKKFKELQQIATAHNKKITDAIIEIENGKYYVGKTYFSATLIKWLRNEKYS